MSVCPASRKFTAGEASDGVGVRNRPTAHARAVGLIEAQIAMLVSAAICAGVSVPPEAGEGWRRHDEMAIGEIGIRECEVPEALSASPT